MSLYSDMTNREQQDLVWKALADPTRRDMLDALAAGPLSTGALVEQFDSLCRTNVMKHLDTLVQANLVVIRREGRLRWNYLNPVPIQRICDRWVSKHVKKMASALSHLKDHVEQDNTEQNDKGKSATPKASKRKQRNTKTNTHS